MGVRLAGNMNYPYNPKHKTATCADCGEEMVYNVPRLGANGGYFHKDNKSLDCKVKVASAEEMRKIRLQSSIESMSVPIEEIVAQFESFGQKKI